MVAVISTLSPHYFDLKQSLPLMCLINTDTDKRWLNMLIRSVVHAILELICALRTYCQLSPVAKTEHRRDWRELPLKDPGVELAIDEAMSWLCRAQDNSLSKDGGVARHFSMLFGWSTSYPETTGYIVPTMFEYAKLRKDETVRLSAKKMLDWLLSIQLQNGGFQGGIVNSKPVVPVTFNTGQILIGLASGVRELGKNYHEAMCRAADWLVKTQDRDGCWRKYPTPFATIGEKAYETHVAWGLLEAGRIEPDRGYAETAIANINWALNLQKDNGWFNKCCLETPSLPLTHTLGYVLRGIIEGYRFTKDPVLLHACLRTANGLLSATREDGFLPGRLYANWQGAVPWSCLTGSVQIAICWLLLYQYTGDIRYRDSAYAVNKYVRRTMKVDGPQETRGGIKGSFPVYGAYGTYEYLNWACKFFVDANILEKEIRRAELQ